ncbi:Stage II sporulation protein M [compost metagenome]
MLFALVAVVPQNLIVIPAILFCSVAAMSFSIYMIKHRIMSRSGNIYQPFMRYTTITLMMGGFLLAAALLEGYLSQYMMKWVTPMLVGVYGQ